MRAVVLTPKWYVRLAILLPVLLLAPTPPCHAAKRVTASDFLSIGKIGPDAVKLKTAIVKLPRKPTDEGEPIAVRLTAGSDSYVTVLYLSPRGCVTVLLPNTGNADTRLKAGVERTLFGEGSGIRLTVGSEAAKAKIVCFVTAQPVKVDLTGVPKGMAFLTISRSLRRRMEDLKNRITEAAKAEGFNRHALSIVETKGLKMMGVPKSIKSKKPGSVTGVQGVREETPALDAK